MFNPCCPTSVLIFIHTINISELNMLVYSCLSPLRLSMLLVNRFKTIANAPRNFILIMSIYLIIPVIIPQFYPHQNSPIISSRSIVSAFQATKLAPGYLPILVLRYDRTPALGEFTISSSWRISTPAISSGVSRKRILCRGHQLKGQTEHCCTSLNQRTKRTNPAMQEYKPSP